MVDYAGVAGYLEQIIDAAVQSDMTWRGWTKIGDNWITRDDLSKIDADVGLPLQYYFDKDKGPAQSDLSDLKSKWDQKIHGLFKDWLEIPDAGASAAVGQAFDAYASINRDASAISSGGPHGGQRPNNDTLASNYTDASGSVRDLKGEALDSYRVWLSRLDSSMTYQAVATSLLGKAIDAETLVLGRCRADVAQVATDSLSPMQQAVWPGGGGGDASWLIWVVGAVAIAFAPEAAGAVIPAAASATATAVLKDLSRQATEKAVDLGGEALEEEPPSEHAKISGDSPDDVFASMQTAFENINKAVSSEETRLANGLSTAASTMQGNPEVYQLAAAPNLHRNQRHDYTGSAQTIKVVHADLINAADGLDGVAHQLGTSQFRVDAIDAASAWTRPDSIGIGPEGPIEQFESLRTQIYFDLQGIIARCRESGHHLQLTAELFDSTDSNDAAAMKALTRDTSSVDSEQSPYEPPIQIRRGMDRFI